MPSTIINPVDGLPFGVEVRARGGSATLAADDALMLCQTQAGAVTVTMPPAPVEGSCVAVVDAGANAATNAITVNGNGNNIDGAATLVLNTSGIVAAFVYDAGQWRRVAVQRDYPQIPPPAQFSRSSELGAGGSVPDPLTVADLNVTSTATIANLIATVRTVSPYYAVDSNPANIPASGVLRIGEVATDVIVGLQSGVDYAALAYNPGSAAWAYGNLAQFSTLQGYAAALYGSFGCSSYDGRSGITTDLTRYEAILSADADTTSLTRANTPFAWAIGANEDWTVELDLWVQNSSGNGLRFAWDLPAGAVATTSLFGCTTATNVFTSTVDTTINNLIPTTFSNAAVALRLMRVAATIRNGANAGTATFQFAAVTSGTARIGIRSKCSARRATAV